MISFRAFLDPLPPFYHTYFDMLPLAGLNVVEFAGLAPGPFVGSQLSLRLEQTKPNYPAQCFWQISARA